MRSFIHSALCLLLTAMVGLAQSDFGDAPDSYGTTLPNGARHVVGGAFRLGTLIDPEADGQPGPAAQGDDGQTLDDEDGVTGPAQWPQGSVVTLSITATAGCRLDAWVDWAGNGQWTGHPVDARDQIAASLALSAGTNTLPIYVPELAVPGPTYARFRVSQDGCLGPAGAAPDGEVEDYPLVITAAPQWPEKNDVSTSQSGNLTQMHWTGQSQWSWQVEMSADLASWVWLSAPAAETAGPMSTNLPAATPDRVFYRIRRSPVVTSPVACRPGEQLHLSFIHENGSRVWNAATGTFTTSSIARSYNLYVPPGWTNTGSYPLALLLHGHAMTADTLAATQWETRQLARERGYIVVIPDSTGNENNTRWFCHPDPSTIDPAKSQNYVDDKEFLYSLLRHLVLNTGLRVNPGRLYCAGFSNGGSMTHYLSSFADHPFRAFAIMESGLAFISNNEPFQVFDFTSGNLLPAKPRPCLIMNMITSTPWPYEGGALLNEEGIPVDANGDMIPDQRPSARDAVQRWLTGNGLSAPPLLSRTAYRNTAAVATELPSVENHFVRPDNWWITSHPDWVSLYAQRPFIPDLLRTPADPGLTWFLTQSGVQSATGWPQLTFTENRRTYWVAGTWSEEKWATPVGQSDREVKFLTLSSGGHQWPSSNDGTGWNGQAGVMDFFDAH